MPCLCLWMDILKTTTISLILCTIWMTTSLWVLRILIFVPTTFRLLYRWLPGWEYLWLSICGRTYCPWLANSRLFLLVAKFIPSWSHWLNKCYSIAPSPSLSRSSLGQCMLVKVPSDLKWPCYYSRPLLVQIAWLCAFYRCIRHPWLCYLLLKSLDCQLLSSHAEGPLGTVEAALPNCPFLPFGETFVVREEDSLPQWLSACGRYLALWYIPRPSCHAPWSLNILQWCNSQFYCLGLPFIGTDDSIADFSSRLQMVSVVPTAGPSSSRLSTNRKL